MPGRGAVAALVLGLVCLSHAADSAPKTAFTATVASEADGVVPEVCPSITGISAEMKVDSLPLAAGWEFTVGNSSDGKVYGKIDEDLVNIDRTLIWSWDGNKVAVGERTTFSLGTEIKVMDCHAVEIAKISEQILTVFKTFAIATPDGTLAARSDKVDLGLTLSPEFSITSADGKRELAKISRPVFAWGQQWTIERIEGNAHTPLDRVAQDPRVLSMLAAFATANKGSETKGLVWFFMIGGPIVGLCCIYACVRAARANMNGGSSDDGL